MTEAGPTRELEPLAAHHAVSGFSCGVPELDDWLRESAATVAAKHLGRTYVWIVPDGPMEIAGYVTLAPHVVRRLEVPGRIGRGAPDAIPAILLARLALATPLHGTGLGGALLADALRRALDAIAVAGGRLVVVDALDEGATGFYEHHGFARIPGTLRLSRKATDIARDLDRDPATLLPPG